MAKILRTSEQEQALNTINDNIKMLKGINVYLEEASESTAETTLTLQTGKRKAVIPYATVEAVKMISAFRKGVVSRTKTLADRYSIGLDEDDIAVLDYEAGRKAKKKEEPEFTDRDIPAGDFMKMNSEEKQTVDDAVLPDILSDTESEENTESQGW